MATQNTVIGYGQMFRFTPERTAIWLKKYLNENGRNAFTLQNYVSHVCAVLIIYTYFRPDRSFDVVSYHEEMFAAFRQEDWSLDMLRYLPHLRTTFFPNEWAYVWKMYYKKMRRKMMAKNMPSLNEQLQMLDEKFTEMLKGGQALLAKLAAEADGIETAPG